MHFFFGGGAIFYFAHLPMKSAHAYIILWRNNVEITSLAIANAPCSCIEMYLTGFDAVAWSSTAPHWLATCSLSFQTAPAVDFCSVLRSPHTPATLHPTAVADIRLCPVALCFPCHRPAHLSNHPTCSCAAGSSTTI